MNIVSIISNQGWTFGDLYFLSHSPSFEPGTDQVCGGEQHVLHEGVDGAWQEYTGCWACECLLLAYIHVQCRVFISVHSFWIPNMVFRSLFAPVLLKLAWCLQCKSVMVVLIPLVRGCIVCIWDEGIGYPALSGHSMIQSPLVHFPVPIVPLLLPWVDGSWLYQILCVQISSSGPGRGEVCPPSPLGGLIMPPAASSLSAAAALPAGPRQSLEERSPQEFMQVHVCTYRHCHMEFGLVCTTNPHLSEPL